MTTGLAARRIVVSGTVQGVGFRPFVWRLATRLGLGGTVRNLGGRVEIHAYGEASTLDVLATRLRTEAPARARVESVAVTPLPPATSPLAVTGPAVFTVVDSGTAPSADRLFPPDLATCDACLCELFDPADRRYRYPFITCTDCGPRATIIDRLPYDRARTTMADFPLCARCRAEYLDPADRRFHAEPVACQDCGPRLWWRTAGSSDGAPVPAASSKKAPSGEDALAAAVDLLRAGGIVAVKGLGGYHLACDATDEAAVRRLRERKFREAKPFAVMVGDLAAATDLAMVDSSAQPVLTGPEHPIVLLPTRAGAGTTLASSVLCGYDRVGLFLPYTGLHHLLLHDLARPIVLTSGNRSDEPIAVDDEEAVRRLGGIADGFLGHDRRIRSRYEDSVVALAGTGPVLVRRARGYAPQPLDLPVPAPEPVLAVGAQLKHTFALVTGWRGYVSGHTGDLADVATLDAYHQNLAHLRELLDGLDPRWVAHDLHPGYLSTQEAAAGFPAARRVPVQHHHAHVASCMAEHGLAGPVVGVALDGLGMGEDGTLWGGEVMVADLTGYRRVARFGRAPMPGGEAAIRQPWRMALGYLYGAETFEDSGEPSERGGEHSERGGGTGPARHLASAATPFLQRFDPAAVRLIGRQIERGVNAPLASSAGRLFDAAASLLGLRDAARYEGEAAVALEQAADPRAAGALPYRLVMRDGIEVFDPRPALAALLSGHAGGTPVPVLAARFQRTVATAVVALAANAAAAHGLSVVCLSGGVFQNAWLLRDIPRRLARLGLTVRHNQRVPAGDGGISFGQAAVAAARLHAKGGQPCA